MVRMEGKEMAYAIGEVVWRKGEEVTITTQPFDLFGGWWQDGISSETGKTVCVPTQENVAARSEKQRADHAAMQAGFHRLHKRGV